MDQYIKNGDLDKICEIADLNHNIILCQGAGYGHLNLVQYAMNNGADIHYNDDLSLRLACQNEHTNIVQYLIEMGANIHVNNEESLLTAALRGYMDIVRILVETGADIHVNDDAPLRICFCAKFLNMEKNWKCYSDKQRELEIVFNRMDMLNFLIIHVCVNLNLSEQETWNNRYFEIVDYLIDNGSNIRACDNFALKMSIKYGYLEMVKYLVNLGSNATDISDYIINHCTDVRILQIFLDVGTDINLTAILKKNVIFGNFDMVKYLVMKGEDVNRTTLFSLKSSLYHGDNIMQYLIKSGMDISKYSSELLLDCCMHGLFNAVKYLIDNGANIHYNNESALFSSLNNYHPDITLFLMKNGADVSAREYYAFNLIGTYSYVNIMDYLMEVGVDIHVDNIAMKASLRNHCHEMIDYLIDHGADIRAQNDEILLISAQEGLCDLVEYSVDHGADVSIFTEANMHSIISNGYIDVALYLVKKGVTIHDSHCLAILESKRAEYFWI
jgi:ankyrin repeat protein